MAVNRKCKKCGHWTSDADYCENCGALINLDKIQEKETLEKEKQKEQNTNPDKIDRLFEFLKNSSNPLYKLTYYILYSIWVIFAGITSFIVWLISVIAG